MDDSQNFRRGVAPEPGQVIQLRQMSSARAPTLLNMNMEVADLLGSAQLSGHGVSFAADNVIQLKFVELEGRLDRALSVLKAQGVRHTTDVRPLTEP